jgi:hypothetical protein
MPRVWASRAPPGQPGIVDWLEPGDAVLVWNKLKIVPSILARR